MFHFKNYKTLDEIYNYIWYSNDASAINGIPDTEIWKGNKPPQIKDVRYWEQIYHQPGNFGIYAAHDPLAEFYIIIFYPLLKFAKNAIVEFYGESAVDDIIDIAEKYEIKLPIQLSKT